MKTYYIYHIPGVKIGCTSQIEIRMRNQGFTEWEILEEHTDIYEASDREIQLQKDYGLPVDKIPYRQALENRYKFDSAYNKTKRTITFEIANQIRQDKKHLTYDKLQVKYNIGRCALQRIINNKTYLTP